MLFISFIKGSKVNIEEEIQKLLQANLPSFMSSVKLFDYNKNGNVQIYEFRRIIERTCFKLTDQQFARLLL